jgi:hypothetical protein
LRCSLVEPQALGRDARRQGGRRRPWANRRDGCPFGRAAGRRSETWWRYRSSRPQPPCWARRGCRGQPEGTASCRAGSDLSACPCRVAASVPTRNISAGGPATPQAIVPTPRRDSVARRPGPGARSARAARPSRVPRASPGAVPGRARRRPRAPSGRPASRGGPRSPPLRDASRSAIRRSRSVANDGVDRARLVELVQRADDLRVGQPEPDELLVGAPLPGEGSRSAR